MGLLHLHRTQNLPISMEILELGTLRVLRLYHAVLMGSTNDYCSNPYTGATRPGTASVAAVAKAPVSATYDPNNAPDLTPEHEPIKDCLIGVLGSLSATSLSPTDKRQLSESEKGVAVLLKRLARGDIEQGVTTKVLAMVDALNNRDYATATWVQTSLVNNDWRENKDWLKGIKCLVLLAAKKL